MNLVTLGEDRLSKMGDRLSYVFEGEDFTTFRLNEMTRRLANGLKSLGIGKGDHVVVSMPNSPEVFTCFQAIWRIGAVIVPIMFLLGENETRYILDHSDAKAVITSKDLLGKIESASRGIAQIKQIIVLGGEDKEGQLEFHGLLNSSEPESDFEEIAAFIVKMPGQELVEEDIIEFAKSKMTPYKAPSQVRFVDGLPKSLVGKVLKKELRKLI